MTDDERTSPASRPQTDAAASGDASAAAVSRRELIGLAIGASATSLVVGAGAGVTGGAAYGQEQARRVTDAVAPAAGIHQPGITTPVQDHLHFASYDMMARTTRDDLAELLADWTYAATRMMRGLDVSASGAVGGSPEAPPDDTGEALGLPASNLTITFGFGPSLFDQRFGLEGPKPAGLERLPAFLGDDLDPLRSDGDLCIQACADDPQVAVHAIRNLSRIAFGRATIRWSQLGFGRTSKTTASQATPRNLFGYKDGTANILADDTAALDENVWVSVSEGPAWLAGGSYLVARRIAMLIETWDRTRLAEQDRVVGRDKANGAPLSGGDEFAAPDFAAVGAGGAPAIDPRSHVRLAHPDMNGGIRLLRRGYNFVDGTTDLGRLNAGLFFLSFQKSPDRYITVQKALATDAMGEYLRHVGSGLWAVPPAAPAGTSIGAGLLGA
ncbi:deferrochelatase/peroxidase EfeB [Microbacterium sp. ru370.1]|uniref:iron uptake transporter deferrochelatase/peroxidase subunit n=1 Tax=unclassified Microbacterium TaxID=2609290 RepID=UPI0008900756|nr:MULTISPECIES: iron uptake transporter deferrochelatase/peroxidase subunit [unclassified Microbacterium]SDO57619.1 deferrochelatase/peroxidase EfeB [Microbacterium sp. ru370.1]SIT85566.1 deferrochelatase/peroxidase EfeB [Microbacterium sp. RU1D]